MIVYLVYVNGEWDDHILGSPFAQPKSDHHGDFGDHHKPHIHHDPRGDKIKTIRKKVAGVCGGEVYFPRSHICCDGILHRRQGMRPACCGDKLYDFVFDLCCDENKVRPRTVGRPVC
ncbi:hypothetical protein LOTGIDRAFT_153896 [Lottia gigantea]|uniref:Galaxin-like repeats domain-containing protein n=1 Tax=Lottia gigantea TaxID=225164 RepID=V4A443_LOTGI|nr:hypothetical protein LOTGIDRAFT_153896 [Lottia gigantea]ESO91452.1 hypothetical protein LOTGIDRAFT_153896 [Lottia gigantea]